MHHVSSNLNSGLEQTQTPQQHDFIPDCIAERHFREKWQVGRVERGRVLGSPSLSFLWFLRGSEGVMVAESEESQPKSQQDREIWWRGHHVNLTVPNLGSTRNFHGDTHGSFSVLACQKMLTAYHQIVTSNINKFYFPVDDTTVHVSV